MLIPILKYFYIYASHLCPCKTYSVLAPPYVYAYFSYASRLRSNELEKSRGSNKDKDNEIIDINMVVREQTKCVKALISYT